MTEEAVKGLPATFPSGTEFGEWDDIPLTKEPGWVVKAWDSIPPRRFSTARFGEATLLTESRFRALVAVFQNGKISTKY